MKRNVQKQNMTIFSFHNKAQNNSLNECERSDNIILENKYHVHSNTCDHDEATPRRPLR